MMLKKIMCLVCCFATYHLQADHKSHNFLTFYAITTNDILRLNDQSAQTMASGDVDQLIRYEFIRCYYSHHLPNKLDQLSKLTRNHKTNQEIAEVAFLKATHQSFINPTLSIAYFKEAAEKYKIQKDTIGIMYAYYGIISQHFSPFIDAVSDVSNIRHLYNEVMAMGMQSKNVYTREIYLRTILLYGDYFLGNRLYDYYQTYVEELNLILCQQPNFPPYTKYLGYHCLAFVHSKYGLYDMATKYYTHSYAQMSEYNSRFNWLAKLRLGNIYYLTHQLELSKKHLLESEGLYNELPNDERNYFYLIKIYHLLCRISIINNDRSQSENYIIKMNSATDKYLEQRNKLYFKNLSDKFEIEQKNTEARVLTKYYWILTSVLSIVLIILTMSIILFYKVVQINKKLKKQIKIRDYIHSTIAHDLNSPFISTEFIIQAIQNKLALQSDDVLIKWLDQLKSNFYSTRMLLKNLLDWYKSNLNAIVTEEKTDFNLHDIIENNIAPIAVIGDTKNCKISNAVDKSLFIQQNPMYIGAILRNIIDNIYKYSDSTNINIQCHPDHKKVKLIIQDNGEELSEQILEALNSKACSIQNNCRKGLGLVLISEFLKLAKVNLHVTSKNRCNTYVLTI